MFGHQDDKHDDQNQEHEQAAQAVAPDQPADQPYPEEHTQGDHGVPAQDDAQNDSHDDGAGDDGAWQHPDGPGSDAPMDDGPGPINDIVGPAGGHHSGPMPPMPHHDSDGGDDDDDAKVPHELIDIKQKALGKLSPLVDKLDQSPEERFRTIMMMIQASDDQHLVKEAYEAAGKIEDEKVRAQALLDVVNEINYFTQHPQPE